MRAAPLLDATASARAAPPPGRRALLRLSSALALLPLLRPAAEQEECRQKARALFRAAEEAVRFAAGEG